MTEDVGRRAATVAEAREMLGAPRRERPTRRELLSHPIETSEASPQ
jgi:hypothetical protein